MTNTAAPLCCSRLESRLTMEKANLGRLAKKAAVADQRNRDISKLKAAMVDCRGLIAEAKAAIVDHEADHAAGTAA